jgi:hypothetical protein
VSSLRRVLIESPFAGRHGSVCRCDECKIDVDRNRRYRDALLRDSLLRGEAPIASTKLYAEGEVLDDTVPVEREIGIEAGLVWGGLAEVSVVGDDLGISVGMQRGIERAVAEGRPVVHRSLPAWAGVTP